MKTKLQPFFKFSCTLLLVALFQTMVSGQETSFNLSQMTKYLNGVQTTEDLSLRTDIAVIGIKDANTAYYFTSDAGFENWAEKQPGMAEMAKRNKALNSIYNYALTHGYLELEENAPIPEDLQQYMNQLLPPPPQGSFVLTCKFHDLPNLAGASKFCTGPFRANLGSFRNKASSALGTGSGLATFCDYRWFGGQKTHVPFVGAFMVPHFDTLNDRIESYISY